jgi:hypothetical protein
VTNVTAFIVLIGGALVWLVYRPPPGAPVEERTDLRIDLSGREWLLISLAGLTWGAFNAGYVIFVSFLPDLFVSRGFSLPHASRLVSILAWSVIVSVPLAGYVADRLKWPNLMMMGGFLGVAAAAALLPAAATPLVPFVVIATMIGLAPGLIMALPAQALRPGNRSAGMGVFYTWHFAAMAVFPALAGSARDLSESTAAPSLFAAFTMVLSAIALMAFRAIQRRAT